jgi:hypothetical protein
MGETARRAAPVAALNLARIGTVVLFVGAAVNLATLLFSLLVSIIVGAVVGVAFASFVDRAAIAYGRRVGWHSCETHLRRQAEHRERTAAAEAAAAAEAGRGVEVVPEPTFDEPMTFDPTRPVFRNDMPFASLPVGLVAPAASSPPAGDNGRLPRFTPNDRAAALVRLRGLMNETLQPHELVGQQGRGVIQLSHELAPLVKILDADTVTAYITDHILVAAGQPPMSGDRWPHDLLDGVTRLTVPAGVPDLEAVGLEQVDGLDVAAGDNLPGLLDMVVQVIVNSGRAQGMHAGQIQLCVEMKGYRIGAHTMAVALARLVKDGRLTRAVGAGAFRLSEAEMDRRARGLAAELPDGDHADRDLVLDVLRGGPVAGMTTGEILAGLAAGRHPAGRPALHATLRTLLEAGVVVQSVPRGPWQLAEPTALQVLAGGGLRSHVLAVISQAPTALTLDAIADGVRARPGFGGTAGLEVRTVVDQLVAGRQLWEETPGAYRCTNL